MKNITYDATHFNWNKDSRTFSADAWELFPVGAPALNAFPNYKEDFYIRNSKTGNQELFKFVEEYKELFTVEDTELGNISYESIFWEFKNQNNDIYCKICISP